MSNQQQHSGLQPMHGRPRSRTAPSTPMAEAPTGSQASPVELPGSMPIVKRSHAQHQSMDSRALRTIMTLPPGSPSLGHSIDRPHSSPQESNCKLPAYPRQSSDSFSRSVANLQPPIDPVPRSKTSSPHRQSRPSKSTLFNTSEDTLVAPESDASSVTTKRSPLSILSGCQTLNSPNGHKTKSQPRIISPVPQLPCAAITKPGSEQDKQQPLDSEGSCPCSSIPTICASNACSP